MPSPTQHTLITWIPDSPDGEKEARSLNALYRNYSEIMHPAKLNARVLSEYMSLIVVGHRKEFESEKVFGSFVELLKGSQLPWLVLANCSSGQAKNFGALGDNEIWAPAQKLANLLKIKVSGTLRALTFDEVGKGQAFALAIKEILIRSNPSDGSKLWRDFEPQDDITEITEGLKNL